MKALAILLSTSIAAASGDDILISDIQGAGATSAMEGQSVSVSGIVKK